MSRTKRNQKYNYWWKNSEISHVEFRLEYWKRNPTKRVKSRKTKCEYDRDVAKAMFDWENGPKIRYYWNWITKQSEWHEVPKPYVSRWKYHTVDVSYEEAYAEAVEEYRSRFRDGKYSETGRKTGFKNATKRKIRSNNRAYCTKVMKGLGGDKCYPDVHETDHMYWSWF